MIAQTHEDRHQTIKLLADAGSLTELARRWLVGAERAQRGAAVPTVR